MRRSDIPTIAPSEITPETVWLTRRELLRNAGLGALAAGTATLLPGRLQAAPLNDKPALTATPNPEHSVNDTQTPESDIISYNNFYEFGTDKGDPARRAERMQTEPWTVRIEGEVLRPRTYDIEDLLNLADMEERIYRLRCVEGWSMVIPWAGYSLSRLLDQVQPTGNAKYVEFITAL